MKKAEIKARIPVSLKEWLQEFAKVEGLSQSDVVMESLKDKKRKESKR